MFHAYGLIYYYSSILLLISYSELATYSIWQGLYYQVLVSLFLIPNLALSNSEISIYSLYLRWTYWDILYC
jgi:hypothetical protein